MEFQWRKPRNPWGFRKEKEFPVVPVKSYSRYNDFTFSLGRKTDLVEVRDLLVKAGCFPKEDLLKHVNQLRLTGNVENGQIFVECKNPDVNDIFVDKLNSLTMPDVQIRKCHSYSKIYWCDLVLFIPALISRRRLSIIFCVGIIERSMIGFR